MAKYLISRLLLVFLIKFFYSWAFNTKAQLVHFFDINVGFGLTVLSYILTFLVIVLAVFTINILFTILNMKGSLFVEIRREISKNGFVNSINTFIYKFFKKLGRNIEVEVETDKYPSLFIILAIFILPFIKGNPIFKNYYGIYKEYEIEGQGRYAERTDYVENKKYIIHKSEKDEIKEIMNSLENEYDKYEPDFRVKKRGYLFAQAGMIDGYKSLHKEYYGLLSYVECLLFSVLEKLINSIMYFLIPFVISILIIRYKFENK